MKVMCNWTPHCENVYCAHRRPHTTIKIDMIHNCNRIKAWCPSEDKWVKCVKVLPKATS